MLIFFIVVPIIVGVLLYKKLDYWYKLFFYSSVFSLAIEIIFHSYKFSSIWNNIFNYMSELSWLPLATIASIHCSELTKKKLYFGLYVILSLLFVIIEIYILGLNENRASLALSACYLLLIIFLTNSFVSILRKKILVKDNLSRMLVVIPLLVTIIYGTSLNIFLFFLFSESTMELFKILYNVFLVMIAVNYLLRGVAFFLISKREVFI